MGEDYARRRSLPKKKRSFVSQTTKTVFFSIEPVVANKNAGPSVNSDRLNAVSAITDDVPDVVPGCENYEDI